ncbi:hypothetical protein L2E82_15344 [Cichorium intybus]|uniref:Uncharacterized protein n=1 Tax=Cichorium intybus TaxID=13427 RepID=A0ACB9F258_CICIN|nr:hypothetical protein L2E82_15344 [Cichorium intybus]
MSLSLFLVFAMTASITSSLLPTTTPFFSLSSLSTTIAPLLFPLSYSIYARMTSKASATSLHLHLFQVLPFPSFLLHRFINNEGGSAGCFNVIEGEESTKDFSNLNRSSHAYSSLRFSIDGCRGRKTR